MHNNIVSELRNPSIYFDIVKYIENNIQDAFNLCCRKNLSLNEKYPDIRYNGQICQKTVFLTNRMFDLWETAIVDIFNSYFNKNNIKINSTNDSIGDLAIIFPDNAEMRWEIKSSQAQDSFTGTTHSASKCNNYILINYTIDKNLKLGKINKNFITELAVLIWENMEIKWIGNPTNHNSFTTLKIPSNIIETHPEIIVVGKLIPKKKWCKIIRSPII